MIWNRQKYESFAALKGMCHGWLLHFVYNASYASLLAMKLEKSQLHAKQICLPSILSNNTNNEDEANKFSKTLIISCNPFKSSSSLSIRTAFSICCVIPASSFDGLSSYFCVSRSLVAVPTVWTLIYFVTVSSFKHH